MSIDIEIVPMLMKRTTWEELLKLWKNYLQDYESKALLGSNPKLKFLGNGELVSPQIPLILNKSYIFDLAIDNTLLLSFFSNENDPNEEVNVLEEHGVNLSISQIKEIAQVWNKNDFNYDVTTFGGRSRQEPRLFTSLVCALAETCNGYIIVKNSKLFSTGLGVFTIEEFRDVETHFFANQ